MQPGNRNTPLLSFNYLPVRFRANSFEGGVITFESKEQLAAIRAELADSHVVARTKGQIACIPWVAKAEAHGTETVFAIKEHQALTMRLVQEALLRAVIGWRYKLRRLAPPTFVSRMPGKDLLEPLIRGSRVGELASLHVYPQFRLDSRMVGPSGRPGVVVGIKTRYEIDMTVQDLLRCGIDVIGHYVLGHDDRLALHPVLDAYATRRAVGAVERVEGDRLILRDAPELASISADAAWLESRRETFIDVVTTLAGVDASRIAKELEVATFDLLGAAGRLGRTVDIADRLSRRGEVEIANGLSIAIEQPVGTSKGRKVSSARYTSPTFLFDQGGDKTSHSADRGLDEYGPFDAEFFAKKQPRIAVIAPKIHKGTVENFIAKFLNGVRGAKVFNLGFVRKYHLGRVDISMHTFSGDATDAAAYRQACRDALKSGPPDLAIVVTSEAQEHLTGDDSPYLVAKSVFMGQGVPVQDVQIETMRLGNIAYPLNSIALACYAKLGGIPFVIAAPKALAHELVFGIGSAHIKSSRLTDPERVVGITTVFSADGNYLLSNKSREADYDDYADALLQSLKECISDIKARNAWQKSDELRLIFHVFKPLKDIETIAVKNLVEQLAKQYAKVEFAFVHISTDHDWTMFDRASVGIRSSGAAKGRLVADRGHAVPIGAREMLLSVSGPYDLKSELHGVPKPLLIKLHKESTFTDIEYLSRQAYRFTSMSWRNMYPSHMPVTILYSDLIARLLGQLRHVRNWNADAVATQLRGSRWFL
ncbi:argonaute/piwi family protein [Nonomuraea sp. NPDC001699]